MIDDIKPLAEEFMSYCQKKHGFEKPPVMNFIEDEENAMDPMGKTAYYDPQKQEITLYITNRHPKDILRSLAHELTHHLQNLRGEFDNIGELGEDYAQTDDHMRKMEFEAYASGLDVRDFENDRKKALQKESSNMSTSIKSLLRKIIKEVLDENKVEEGFLSDMFGRKEEEDEEYVKDPKDPRTHLNRYGDPIWPDGSPRLHSKSWRPDEEELTEEEEALLDSVLNETEEETLEENEEETLEEEASTDTEETTKVQTPEQENAIYESRFTSRDNKLFERLLNKWAKK